jgi:DNA invertase Pin-like site-specific DNA recombinase
MRKKRQSFDVTGDGITGRSAVIYCRVACVHHDKPFAELEVQEQRCAAYAEQRGLTVLRVFKERDSGLTTKRPFMTSMIDLLRQRDPGVIVIVEDISRMARGIREQFEIRDAIESAGGVIEAVDSAAIDNAKSIHIEDMLVSVSAHRALRKDARP